MAIALEKGSQLFASCGWAVLRGGLPVVKPRYGFLKGSWALSFAENGGGGTPSPPRGFARNKGSSV